MDALAPQLCGDVLPGALEAAAADALHAEPAWITKAAELGYAWARIMWRRAASVAGSWFDYAKADKVVEIWPRYFTLTDDRFAGQPFHLAFWEEVVLRMLIGWKAPVEVADPASREKVIVYARLYRQLRLWIPRKNGKSEFLAALGLLFWALEGVPRGQGFCFARDEAQGRMVFDKMSDMVSGGPDALKRSVRVFNKHLWLQARKAAFRLLSGKPEGKHGRGPVVIVGDEMHEWTSKALMNTLRQGTGTRLQPIELYASTAGPKSAEVGYSLWDESIKILDGTVEDASTLVVIFAADEDDDWTNEAVWGRANPSLGLSPTIGFLRRELAYAKESPRAEAEFKCFHLNQWVDHLVRWLPKAKWDACAPEKDAWQKAAEALAGRDCYAAIDASATQDLTALVLVFPPQEDGEKLRVVCRFFCPEAAIERRTKARVDYENWRKRGALEATPGDAVDQDYVLEAILWALEAFNVLKIGRDPWNTIKLVTDAQKRGVDPELFCDMRQGHATLGEPTKELERLVFAGAIDHGAHPVLSWMAGNAHVRFDENLNFVPAKKRSRDKIDGIVALVMGIGLWMGLVPIEGPSVYEQRGVVEVEL